MERKWWTLIVVSVATFMLLLDITVVNTALPAIQEDLDASFTDLQWVVDAYTLSLAALVLTAGVLADRLGRRRVFAAGLGIFTVASALAGSRAGSDLPQPRARAPGRGRRDHVRRLARAGGPGVQARPRARRGDGRVRRDHRRGGGVRPAGGRRPGGVDRLGVDLLPERADRHRGARGDLRAAARVARPQRLAHRLGRAGHVLDRAVPARLRAASAATRRAGARR